MIPLPKPKPRAGDVLFVASGSILSRLIRWVLGSRFSHVAFFISSEVVIESDFGGVVASPVAKYGTGWEAMVISPRLDKEQREKAFAFIGRKLGAGYDYSLFLGSGLALFLQRSKRKAGLWDSGKNWICSELVAAALQAGGMAFDLPLSQITPKELHETLSLTGVSFPLGRA